MLIQAKATYKGNAIPVQVPVTESVNTHTWSQVCAGVHAIVCMWKAEGILGYLSLHFPFWNKVSVVHAVHQTRWPEYNNWDEDQGKV